jgi:hypothetical protein
VMAVTSRSIPTAGARAPLERKAPPNQRVSFNG